MADMDSDDDFDWEEVQVPEHEQHMEITLQPNRKAEPPSKSVTRPFRIYLALTACPERRQQASRTRNASYA